jgi:hypothetical protein
LPSAPQNAIAIAGNGGVFLTWDAADTNSGPPISSYKISSSLGGSWPTTTAATTFTISGLNNGTTYTFSVVAINATGPSPAATTNNVTPDGSIPSGHYQQTFVFTGAPQSWKVPAGIASVGVDMGGAAGNNVYNMAGSGGRVQATVKVSAGEVLGIYVGGQGADPKSGGTGGWNGGGGPYSSNDAAFPNYQWGGGGGATDIRIGGTDLANRVMVAGGGGSGSFDPNTSHYSKGGAGGGTTGGGGGYPTVTSNPAQLAGQGGSQTGGGGSGCWYGGSCGGAGSSGQGGDVGFTTNEPGGAGGGGYYGGGGGTSGGAGGGGSSYTDNSLCSSVIHTQGYRSGDGYVTITI